MAKGIKAEGSVSSASSLRSDPDDSWAIYATDAISAPTTNNRAYHLPDGLQVTWKSPKPIRIKQDASLKFEVTDSSGQPVALEPYMGMLCHAAVLRDDGSVFAHLHPSGNYSMAAQSFFEDKLAAEAGMVSADSSHFSGAGHTMHHHHSAEAISSVYLPYEFPEPGNYRIWIQVKISGRVLTSVFDAAVGS
jgi:hypothetical protein